MKINIFEGSRRILYLTMGLYAIGVGLYVWVEKPWVHMEYTVTGPNRVPVYNEKEDCSSDDAKSFVYRDISTNKKVSIQLCFKVVGEGDRKGIPYAEDGKMWLVNNTYSREVNEYQTRVANNFVLSPAETERAQKIWSEKRTEQLKDVAKWLFGGLFVLWLLGMVIGWIARGFAGIPLGKDSRGGDQ